MAVLKTLITLSLAASSIAAPLGFGSNIHIIAARGSTQAPGPGVSLLNLVNQITARVVGVTVSGVDYPAVLGDGYGASVQAGIANLKSQVQQAVAADPDVKIALLGYSQGAQVVMDSICTGENDPFNVQYGNNIRSVVVYGDVTHRADQSFSTGGGRSFNGMIVRDASVSECAPYTKRIISYCNYGDPVCASSGPQPYGWAPHESYWNDPASTIATAWRSLARIWRD